MLTRVGEVEEDSWPNLCCKSYWELRIWEEFFQPVVKQVATILVLMSTMGCSVRYRKQTFHNRREGEMGSVEGNSSPDS